MTEYEIAAQHLAAADAVIIGASNGLSITEGLNLFARDRSFDSLFGDFKKKYGISCILDGLFFDWQSDEERWAFLTRLINHYTAEYKPTAVMDDLKALVGGKPYFIVTSNGEGHFELSGFDAEKVYEVEGNWLELECPSCGAFAPSLPAVRHLASAAQGTEVPSELLPRCPECGAVMDLYTAQPPKKSVLELWQRFLDTWRDKKLCVLELGIGPRNQLIKAPLMQLVQSAPDAYYITVNLGEVYIDRAIRGKSCGINGAIADALRGIREATGRV